MEAQEVIRLPKGERCGEDNCPSDRFYRNDNDGYYYCQNGHRRAGLQATGDDEDAFGTQGKKTRKRAEEREKVLQRWQGKRAFELYLQCYQLILRKQIWWLVKEKGLPAELEVVIFDLWALRLTNLREKVDDHGSDSESQSHLYSSQSEAETATEDDGTRHRRGKKADSTPSLLDALALCYLGTLALRLPVTIGDLFQAATKGELVYLRAIRHVQPAMKERLPAHYIHALDPRSLLKPNQLQQAVMELAQTYKRDCGVIFPSLNHPLLLLRYLRELAVPLDIYPAVTRLAFLVGYDFQFPVETKSRLRVISYPGTQLAALVVIATKLLYPFDGFKRQPYSNAEPAAAVMDWDIWTRLTEEVEQKKQPSSLAYEAAMRVKDSDVFDMEGKVMDEYLDWYQKTWVDETIKDQDRDAEFKRAMFRMFPIESDGNAEATRSQAVNEEVIRAAEVEKIKRVQSGLQPSRAVTETEAAQMEERILRPGSLYKQYRHEADLPEKVKAYYEAIAKFAGLSLHTLVKAVFLTERRLRTWVDAERRKALEQEEEIEADII